MGKVRCKAGLALSVDCWGAGLEQSLDDPLGKGGRDLHRWFFDTSTFRAMIGKEGGTGRGRGLCPPLVGWLSAPLHILGRNIFGPIRGGKGRGRRCWWSW